jgi:ferredoxin
LFEISSFGLERITNLKSAISNPQSLNPKSFMSDRNDRVRENLPGAYYVDSTCIDCDVCRDTAPENFRRSDANSYSFVYKQPLTEEELAACEEAVLCCPVEAIGNDGEQNGTD